MPAPRRSAVAAALAISAAVGVSACSGSDDKPAPKAKDAWSKAQDTAGTYKSMEIKGEGKDDGKPTTMTMKGAVSGDPIQIDGEADGAQVHLVSVGKKNYIKADAAFWSKSSGMPKDMASKFADKWVVEPKKDSANSTNKGFADAVKEIRDDSSTANKKLLSDKAVVTADKVGDQDAWKITSEDKKVTVWLAQNDSYDILKSVGLSNESADDMHTTTYISHDKDYGIKTPGGAKSAEELAKG